MSLIENIASKKEEPVKPVIDEYKGSRVIILNPGSKFPFSFGVGKAKLILQNIEAIADFVKSSQEIGGK